MTFIKGNSPSAETRLKISQHGKGRIPWNKGKVMTDAYRHTISEASKGRRLSEGHKQKLREALVGEKSVNWKGDNVSYSGILKWIGKQLGKPTTCEKCKRENLTGHQIHWANISGNYLRDSSDWIRLCATCHVRFDGIGNRAWVTRRSKNVQN